MVIDVLIVVLLLTTIYTFWLSHRFLRGAVQTVGVVSDIERSGTGKGGSVYRTVAKFQDATGHVRTCHEWSTSTSPTHAIGEQVPVVYDPQNPEHNALLLFWDCFGGVWVVLGFLLPALLMRVGLTWGDTWITWMYGSPLP